MPNGTTGYDEGNLEGIIAKVNQCIADMGTARSGVENGTQTLQSAVVADAGPILQHRLTEWQQLYLNLTRRLTDLNDLVNALLTQRRGDAQAAVDAAKGQ